MSDPVLDVIETKIRRMRRVVAERKVKGIDLIGVTLLRDWSSPGESVTRTR